MNHDPAEIRTRDPSAQSPRLVLTNIKLHSLGELSENLTTKTGAVAKINFRNYS